MGQYWKAVNLTKRQYLDPYKLGAGAKLWEQLANPPGVGAALIVLLAAMPERRGGGDLQEAPIIGSWAGDIVTFAGDYAENSDLPNSPIPFSTVYGLCGDGGPDDFTDITDQVVQVIEHELEGKFVGDGWKQWVRQEDLPEAVANQITTGDPRVSDTTAAKLDVGSLPAAAKPKSKRTKKAAA